VLIAVGADGPDSHTAVGVGNNLLDAHNNAQFHVASNFYTADAIYQPPGLSPIVSGGQLCLQVVWSYVNVRSSPCGAVVSQMTVGQKTTLRGGDRATQCTLDGVSYTWVPIEFYSGWIVSEALEVCSGTCVKVTASTLNVRSTPCGTAVTTLTQNTQKDVTSTELAVANCFGATYLWVEVSEGWISAYYVSACTSTNPTPPSQGNPCNTVQRSITVNAATVALLTKWEGVVPCYYLDPTGNPTICIGHLIEPGEPYHPGTCLTVAQCQSLLLNSDLPRYETCVYDHVKVSLNPNQYGALVDFTYNVGCGNFESSTLLADLNRGQYSSVCGQLKAWVYSDGQYLQGLANRRADECNLFNSCAGFTPLQAARSCPQADPCSSCLLNSQADIFTTYDQNGYNTTCSAENWAFLAQDWCTNVEPWKCYYTGPAGALAYSNSTLAQCPVCSNYTLPQLPETPASLPLPCNDHPFSMCTLDECAMLLDNSTCDPYTGNCIPVSELTLPMCTPIIQTVSSSFVFSPSSILIMFCLLVSCLLKTRN
jgi:lysozyme